MLFEKCYETLDAIKTACFGQLKSTEQLTFNTQITYQLFLEIKCIHVKQGHSSLPKTLQNNWFLMSILADSFWEVNFKTERSSQNVIHSNKA